MLRIAGIVFVAVTLVVAGDTAGKQLLKTSDVQPFTIAWVRFALAALVLLPLARFTAVDWRVFTDWLAIARAMCIACGICSIMTALRTEPIANVYGAFFIGPIVSFVLAVIFLKERPSRLRAALLCIGFLGVLLVVKPGFGGGAGMIFALIAGVSYGVYLAMTRSVAGVHRPVVLLASQLVIGAILITPFGWTLPTPDWTVPVYVLLAASAFASAAGNYLLVIANQRAEASLIAPLVYLQLISATAASVIVFGDWPDQGSLIGIVLIAAAGLLTVLEARPAQAAPDGKVNRGA